MAADSPVEPAAWLDAAATESRALVIEGPAGIGKTHHWQQIVDAARSAGWTVLAARPSEAETRLVASALIDLCLGVSDADIGSLRPVQREALSAALLRSAPGAVAEPSAVATGFTEVVRLLAARTPVLLAVDDTQWLDVETGQVLGFAIRRLPPSGVGVLLGMRTSADAPESRLVGEISRAADVRRWQVPALDPDGLHQLLSDTIGEMPPGARRRVAELSGGNPLYAIELGRALVRGDAAVGRSLSELVGERLAALPARTQQALSAAAAIRQPQVSDLAALGIDDALAPAERAGLAKVRGTDVEFLHPIYAAAAYNNLTGSERLALHARLASVVEGPEERARHLALGASQPDAGIADALAESSDRALARGAATAAVEAMRLAVAMTPAGHQLVQERRLALADLLLRSGEPEAAHEVLETVLRDCTDDDALAKALIRLANVDAMRLGYASAVPHLRRALALTSDPSLCADIHLALGDYEFSAELKFDHTEAAARLLEDLHPADELRLARARGQLAQVASTLLRPFDRQHLEDWVEAERPAGTGRALIALQAGFNIASYTDETDAARTAGEQVRRECLAAGEELTLGETLGTLFDVEFRTGRFETARTIGEELQALAAESEFGLFSFEAWRRLVRVHAVCGDWAALENAEQELANTLTNPGLEEWLGYVRGAIAWSRGDTATAVAEMERGWRHYARIGYRAPGRTADTDLYIEALLATGDLPRAVEVLDDYEERAQQASMNSALAAVARCRALLRAENGDSDGAVAAADEAVRLYDSVDRPYDRARALLTKGQVHRRFKHKALAKQALTEALTEFERLGAAPYAQRARDELARVGLRPPASTDLTETERRVAELAATGMTRADIAAALFISPHTVAANLTRVYRKLGASNRAELVVKVAELP